MFCFISDRSSKMLIWFRLISVKLGAKRKIGIIYLTSSKHKLMVLVTVLAYYG